MGLLGSLIVIASLLYLGFIVNTLVFKEQDYYFTLFYYYAGMPAFWLGYFPLIGILLLLEKCGWEDEDTGKGDRAFLIFYTLATFIGWSIILAGVWLAQYLTGNYDIVPTTQGG